MTPSRQDVPPQIKHQITYFRTPDEWGAEIKTNKKKNVKIMQFIFLGGYKF